MSAPPPRYREHAPHAALARHVECYWTLDGRLTGRESRTHAVLPDGCMDVLFSLGDPPVTGRGPGEAASVIGTMTRPLEVAYAGRVRLVGVRFRPGGCLPYVDVQASELTDRAAPLDAMWGADAGVLAERLDEAAGLRERAAVLDKVLLARSRRLAKRADEPVLRASETLASATGNVSVDAVAEAAGLGRRQLERRFLAAVGIPPKTACRVARFRAAVARLHGGSSASLARVALASGYADQAHFTREFRAFAGVTPGAYRAARAGA